MKVTISIEDLPDGSVSVTCDPPFNVLFDPVTMQEEITLAKLCAVKAWGALRSIDGAQGLSLQQSGGTH
ncbi:hypothetical protein [Chitiniphilus shinanonensis]|uniref:hypothetical protein n=1 Tax=Chitiniphilus shinanonensis TaxID=553088 RepID=UPI0030255F93